MDDYVLKWLVKAKNDLKVARNEMQLPMEEMVSEAVCFHSQQSVEKLLKAFLVTCHVDFGKTHNLELLLETCAREDPEFEELTVGDLSFYAVDSRYPDDFYLPSHKEAVECLALAERVVAFVLRKLNISENQIRIDESDQ